jgi:predicted DCC family thiol-disulfide oxidoreductase YuxK
MMGEMAGSISTLVMTPINRQAYSYRLETSIPQFDGRGPVVFMDGECALCSRTARIIARLDRRGEFRICPVQSELGRAILQHYGLDPDIPDSWIYLADGEAHTSLDAVIAAGTRLGGMARLVRIFLILPRPARDWLYRRIARNRYAIFGREQMCAIPDAALIQRLLT